MSQRPAPAQRPSAPDQVWQRPIIEVPPQGAFILTAWGPWGAACCAGGELPRDVLLLVYALLLSIVQTQHSQLHGGVQGRRVCAFFLKVRGQFLCLLLDVVFELLLDLWFFCHLRCVDLGQDSRPVQDGEAPHRPDLPLLHPVEGRVQSVTGGNPRSQLLIKGREGHVVGHDQSGKSLRNGAVVPETHARVLSKKQQQEWAKKQRWREIEKQNVSKLVFPEVTLVLSESRRGSMWCHHCLCCCCCCCFHRVWPVSVSFPLLPPHQVDTQNTRRANRPQQFCWQRGRILWPN